ncbi:MAG: D-glycero-beta-D-manno-heptose 1-phosphate adenylyltransferase [Dehalococcoidia bacterium]|nr:D-glycero-beta-D-manno-heptose 1-phosphate adenylyltransferase [Dehalococcoidia bacterium]
MGRVVSLEALVRLRQGWSAGGKTVVLTNGCFDLLHVGHVRYLRQARALGDLLIVGLNDDSSVRRLKGPRRPVVQQDDRAELIASLECVDYAVVFAEDTATNLVVALQPDVYVKGGDYGEGGKDLPEAGAVRGYGGRIELIPLVAGRSTTDLVQQVLERYACQLKERETGPETSP